MDNNVNLKDLKDMIARAEEVLQKLKDDDRRRHKQRRIERALERAYAFLNSKEYTQKEADKRTRDVWRSLQDRIAAFWFWLIGILLAGAIIFAGIEAYSYYYGVIICWWPFCVVEPIRPPHDDVPDIVSVNYTETNIYSIYNMIPESDAQGLSRAGQTFEISNTPPTGNNEDYDVDYTVYIVELNDNISKKIDRSLLKYQLDYEDENGNPVSTGIRTMNNLVSENGALKLVSGTQKRAATTKFKMTVWLTSEATDEVQGSAYSFAFQVFADVRKK